MKQIMECLLASQEQMKALLKASHEKVKNSLGIFIEVLLSSNNFCKIS
jgi:hypothetical protein